MIKIRNTSYKPNLEHEGKFLLPLPSPPPPSTKGIWFTELKPHERLFFHQTLNSVRKSRRYSPNPNIPFDNLDFNLQSRYHHAKELFPEKVDTVLQKETVCVETFRVLRNTKDVIIKKPDPLGHPLRISGIKEKISPHSVKLINSGHRTQLTNNGFSRQPADGNFFHY
ncbi:cilia- and flagella-associated protein 276 [Episyrphus balteatus]|uniref:cilia- and flagella-associated protein 276 n=1 Tax=Episyrphus balteatus TaxID=286459 RepID=UPI002485FB27|nr:cilia- and flagella-associated protein 276 [Episyrphus balteatus]